MKVKITSDSTCDLSPELLARYDIALVRIPISLGERFGRDGDISPDDICDYAEASGQSAKTSAVNIVEYSDFFRSWVEEGYSVVHFSLGAGFSSTYQNACIAAQELENVYVVDSANLSAGQGLLVLLGAELAARGESAVKIYETCTETAPRVEASFVIDRLDYLYKGGRCSAMAVFGSNLLKIKPCIEVVNGAMQPTKKYRGPIESVMLHYVADRLTGRTDIDKSKVFVTHTQCSRSSVEHVIRHIRELAPDFEEILETDAGATVTTHCGPNTLGVLFIRK